MIRTLLTTTALTVLMGTAAIAQTTTPAPTDAPATTETAPADAMAPATDVAPSDAMTPVAPDANMGTEAMHSDMREPWDMSAGYTAVDTDNLVTRLLGQPVYSSTGDDAEEIGSVNDLVFTENGEISAVVIGVGGFLGIGEKNVAVDFTELEFTIATDNTERWVLPTTADALNAAPEFTWEDDSPSDMNNNAMAPADNAMAPADNTMAPADNTMAPAAPADPNAMAPADGMATPMAMPREGYAPVEREALTADNLTGATVVGPDGEDIAHVGDILLTEDGQVDAMLIDFGGFLGMGEKRIAVTLDNLDFAANENGDLIIQTDFTREQLEAQPEYNEQTYADDPAQRATDM